MMLKDLELRDGRSKEGETKCSSRALRPMEMTSNIGHLTREERGGRVEPRHRIRFDYIEVSSLNLLFLTAFHVQLLV